jgi:hypothetical protein
MSSLIFGADPTLFVLFALVATIGVIFVIRFMGKNLGTIDVVLTWVFKNHTALRFKAKEDLRGIFLDVLNARGKSIEALKKEGYAIEVTDIDRKAMKAYILEKPKGATGKPQISLLVKQGRTKSSREFITVEGTGQTIDFVERSKDLKDSGNAPLIQEEKSAAKEFMTMLANAATSAGNKMILLFSGAGIGMGVTVLILVLMGHLK